MNQVQQAFYVPKEEERGGSMYLTWAGLRVCDAQHFIGPRILPNYKAVLVVCGNGYIEVEGRTVRLGKGDLFFLFPNVKHHYYADPQNPWVLQWFTYNGGNAQSIMNSLRISEKSPVLHSCMARPLMTCMELILDCMKGSQARPYGMLGYAYQFFDEISRLPAHALPAQEHALNRQEMLQRVLIFIDMNYASTDISVEMLCEQMHYSRSFFSHFFKSVAGVSLPEYINQKRVRQAQALMRSTNMTNAEIARSVGYTDPAYFMKQFKRLVGCTPREYVQAMPQAPDARAEECTPGH